ncbi:class I SAM-dependent methyltransferase [Shewanella dokdonensis]|uniref:Class I SAM-dependent methyltransferase n=1 Tax=Shewanella dokdonensis TaxID=712036 RepID=A0ABX8DF33_9GAMM|nr:class I SAM-dependent methyltransferase [Shewanella dokdonensis]MCL1074869.1 class I SAM-dependent methyltransferase [Shewanella dokdonensis]QVK23333.1 class I SAM-dependent methyltransferase [Shewanella dokdonensis]
MKLNPLERYVVRHPARQWLQRQLEQPLLLGLFNHNLPAVEHALEIGCGFGQGISLIREGFGAGTVTAVDLDDEMLKYCAARYQDKSWLTLLQADATRLPFAAESFELVCDFAVFHHVLDWQAAVAEVFRVLRPGGAFVIEELYRAAICNPLSRRLFEHPQQNRFNHAELHDCLRACGFELAKSRHLWGLAGITLATKPAGSFKQN